MVGDGAGLPAGADEVARLDLPNPLHGAERPGSFGIISLRVDFPSGTGLAPSAAARASPPGGASLGASVRAGSVRSPSFVASSVGLRAVHVRLPAQLLLERSGDRPRHRQHPDLRARQGHRARRALGGGHRAGGRPQRQADDPCGRPRGQADARQGARQHRGDPPDEGRRDRRLRRHRADAEAVHQDGSPQHAAGAESAHHHLRALRSTQVERARSRSRPRPPVPARCS